jgi:hypothetical protein
MSESLRPISLFHVAEVLISAARPHRVLVVVKSGTITFYSADDPDCSPKVHPAGTSFTEQGGIVGNARDEGAVDVVAVATFFAPPASPLRIDAAKPANC